MSTTDLLPTQLLSKLRGKKKKIAVLLQKGELTDEEIAHEVDCGVRYIWNSRCELKKAGLFAEKAQPPPYEKQEGGVSLPQTGSGSSQGQKESMTGNSQAVQTEQSVKTKVQLKSKERKICHTQFLAGKKPPHVVAKYGFDTDAVEAEYTKFLRYKDCDIYALQERFMDYYEDTLKNAGWKAQQLADKYKKNGYLSNDEFIELQREICYHYYEDGQNALADDQYADSPKGWVKILCDVCGQPLGSAVVDPNSTIGKAILQFCRESGWRHASCHQK